MLDEIGMHPDLDPLAVLLGVRGRIGLFLDVCACILNGRHSTIPRDIGMLRCQAYHAVVEMQLECRYPNPASAAGILY
jgi:hypothetical protein